MLPCGGSSLASEPTLCVRVSKVGEDAPDRNLSKVVLPLAWCPITNSLMEVLEHDLGAKTVKEGDMIMCFRQH